MIFKVLVAFSLLNIAAALPGKLLRVPKIYNALITTKEKLLPSEAYPATTGPIFQPIALTGDPILLNANDFINSANQQEAWRKANQDGEGNEDSAKDASPVVFYPRYGVYYPHHTVVSYVNTLQHSFVYTAVDHSKPHIKPIAKARNTGNSNSRSEVTYATNNGGSKVPDVPPPPPPVGYLNEAEDDKEAS